MIKNSISTINKKSSKDKFKKMKNYTFQTGKRESKSQMMLISSHSSNYKYRTENLRPMKFSNGLLSLFMENLKLNIISLTLFSKSLKEIKAKILKKDSEKLTQVLLNKKPKLNQPIFWKVIHKLSLVQNLVALSPKLKKSEI